jgi:hypothetical protein
MALTVQVLEQLIASLSPSEDTEAALNFLKQSDLTQIAPEERSSYSPAEHWHRTYKIRQDSTTKAGIATYGFPSLMVALEELPPSKPLTIAAFKTNEWFGVFWSDQADRLVGFVLVKCRAPQHEQERLDWFRRNMT